MTAVSIKAELKAAGIDTKNIRARVADAGLSTAVTVTINSLDIDIRKVEAVVKQHERIDRDEYNGEILEGCNTYVFVDYRYDLQQSEVNAHRLLSLIDRYDLDGWSLSRLDAAMVGVDAWDNGEVMQRVCDIKNGKVA